MSDRDENTINNGKHVLFQLSKCSDKIYGITVYMIQTEMSHFIPATASLVFTTIFECWFAGFAMKIFRGSKLSYYNFVSKLFKYWGYK